MKKMVLSSVSFLVPLLLTATAFAQNEEAGEAMKSDFAYIAAGLGLGIAAFGGALGQGKAAAAALEGISRNPNASGKLFTPMILGLALIESLVIYALVLGIMMIG